MEGGDSPRIQEEETITPNTSNVTENATVIAPSVLKTSDENVKSEVISSRFQETDKKVRYQYRNSRFAEARQTIEKYMSEMS